MRKVRSGSPLPLGATPDASGTNFSLFSDNAEAVWLCLFSADGQKEEERIAVEDCTNGLWHCYVPDLGPGTVYGWRVKGPWAPQEGHRFNENKLLLDPYAKKLAGELRWDDALYGYTVDGSPDADLNMDSRDSAPFMPKAVVCGAGTLTKVPRARVSWPNTIIYEAHVKGLTMLHPLVGDLRGTFAGLASAPILEHLHRLGVTAIELMPVHAFVQDRHLVESGRRNYWGYNTLAYFAPEPAYLKSGEIEEVAAAVDRLHEAGIEVILDVVYNHTCEGNHLGPTLSWRGIDNSAYYRLHPENARYYDDMTGCGNALNSTHPRVLQMITDSLRHWVLHYGIDGFRFDLAVTLGRTPNGFTPDHPVFLAMLQDPTLNRCKLIAEPWDIGLGGYQLGNFPPGFSEWNGDYRDVIRQFWSGGSWTLPGFAGRFAASHDLFAEGRRRPWSSVNFVTAHDGFTLQDLVSYNEKHNEANGEENRDGTNENYSWNCGAEGPTDNPDVLTLRARQKRNFLATLLLSQGVPMLLAGDELSNTQNGNNNAYCQDNEIGWVKWDQADQGLIDFIARVVKLRIEHSALSRPEFLTGARNAMGQRDVSWFAPDGSTMVEEKWHNPEARFLTVRLSPRRPGEPQLLVMLNAAAEDVTFTVPKSATEHWRIIFDTADENASGDLYIGQQTVVVGRSLRLMEANA